MTPNPPLLPVSEAASYANELREIAGMLAQQPDGPIRWKQYRLAAIADFLGQTAFALQSPPAASQDGAGMREALAEILDRADKTDAYQELDLDRRAYTPESTERLLDDLRALTHQGELQQDQTWFFRRAIETAIGCTPEGRRLVVQPFHQSIYFDSRPALRPDRTWELRAEFKYVLLNEDLPEGWFEGSDILSTPPSDNGQGLREAVGWQPIETAPKDGTHILACEGPYSPTWGFNQRPPVVVHYWDNPGEEGFYLSSGCQGDADVAMVLTHWKELGPTPGCAWCGTLPIREVLDGEQLCQTCCDKWARGEGDAALSGSIEGKGE